MLGRDRWGLDPRGPKQAGRSSLKDRFGRPTAARPHPIAVPIDAHFRGGPRCAFLVSLAQPAPPAAGRDDVPTQKATEALPVRIIDLSREIYHRTPTHPSHPPVVMGVWNDHNEIKRAGETQFTSKAFALSLSDHAGTHVDAPCHFNPDPGPHRLIRSRLRTSTPRPSVSTSRTCR